MGRLSAALAVLCTGSWGGGGGGGGGEELSLVAELAVTTVGNPYTANVIVVYQPFTTKPSVGVSDGESSLN